VTFQYSLINSGGAVNRENWGVGLGVKSLLLTKGLRKEGKGELAAMNEARKTLGQTIKDTIPGRTLSRHLGNVGDVHENIS
jgi:hypothetical protein